MNVCGFRYYLITARKYLKYMTRLLPETILTDLRRGRREPTVEIGYRLERWRDYDWADLTAEERPP